MSPLVISFIVAIGVIVIILIFTAIYSVLFTPPSTYAGCGCWIVWIAGIGLIVILVIVLLIILRLNHA